MNGINIENMTIGQAREIARMFGGAPAEKPVFGSQYIGQKVIIRTYSAGVWFGELAEKAGAEVILKNARRMWRWKAKQSISLSGCAIYGIVDAESKIVEPVASVWLEAIEIIECSPEAIKTLEGAEYVKAE